MGLFVHATAGFVDPGFCGSLTFNGKLTHIEKFELYNDSLFAEGSRILQDRGSRSCVFAYSLAADLN
jgi:deoxycytidine triphosphate deaminase